MEPEAMVSMAFRVPFPHWTRLVALAQRRGLLYGDRPNVSEAARQVLAVGLDMFDGMGNRLQDLDTGEVVEFDTDEVEWVED